MLVLQPTNNAVLTFAQQSSEFLFVELFQDLDMIGKHVDLRR